MLIGAVDDFDVTYVNGKRIGQTDQDTPHHWEVPRRYPIPAGTLHQDKSNVLLIRVTNAGFDGGIFGPIVVGLSSVLHLPKEISRPLTASYQADKEGIHILRLGMHKGDHEYLWNIICLTIGPWSAQLPSATPAPSRFCWKM